MENTNEKEQFEEDIRNSKEGELLERDVNFGRWAIYKEDYGLSFDYVEEGTFTDQREPFIRFQLSYGGPQEEFRFFADNTCEFWYLDWGTGEHKNLDEGQRNLVLEFLGATDWEDLKQLLGEE